MRRMIGGAILAAVLVGPSACNNDQRVPAEPTAPSAAAVAQRRASYLVVSDTAVSSGSTLAVSANVDTASGGERIASYLARVRFNPHQLAYVSEEPISGVLSAVNASDSEVVVAGASATGLPNASLFVLHFRALATLKNPALALEIDELNTVSYVNRTHHIWNLSQVRFDRRLR